MVEHQKPILTIFTDASVRFSKTGWGGWAKRDELMAVTHSGRIRPYIQDTNLAELSAIHNMVSYIKSSSYSSLDVVMSIQCDNINALKFILNSFPNSYAANSIEEKDVRLNNINNIHVKYHEILDRIYSQLYKSPLIYLKHIKGHQGRGSSNRSYVNKLCDKLAKSHTKKEKNMP